MEDGTLWGWGYGPNTSRIFLNPQNKDKMDLIDLLICGIVKIFNSMEPGT
jgi:hypothetical protein